MSILGIDLDVDLRGTISGVPNLVSALVRRLETPNGGLFYDAEYGYLLFDAVQDAITPAVEFEIAAFVETECLKDPRVLTCTVSSRFDGDKLELHIAGTTAEGPFDFVLPIDKWG
ncbi:MAG: hypothetical protein HC933_20010 [Pleurocapsa sp. SU_196_0]|nr:hypothetical protein [Pleurocapsa sp. SU_196_0]